MAEKDSSFFNTKDTVTIKSQRKNPCALRMIVLILVMISGFYIFLVCLKQKESIIRANSLKLKLFDPHRPLLRIPQSDASSYIHYPEPTTYTRSECKRTPVVFFTILSMQRSGSGWFETLLNSHINVSSNGEIFSVKERRANMSSISMTLDNVYNLDWFSSASKNECTAAVGFKWMLNQKLMDVLEFLRLPKGKLVSQHVKIHTRPLSDQVENWDAVSNTLNGTEYESLLHSDYGM